MLLIQHAAYRGNAYSRYLAEILRLEGFTDFIVRDLEDVDAELLAEHDLVLLSRLTPTLSVIDMLAHYLADGGRMIAFMPDPHHLLPLLGVVPAFGACEDNFLHPAPNHPVLDGLGLVPLQIIVPAAVWAPGEDTDATVLATLGPTAESMDAGGGPPAILRVRTGRGEAILYAFDMPHTVARLRQGDPTHADINFSEVSENFRPSDLFIGQLPPGLQMIPQADMHTALFARLIETLAPRPRLWYYPDPAQRSTMVMTSDDDWSTIAEFEQFLAGLRSRRAHCSFYVVPGTHLKRRQMDAWEAEGHTFSVHPQIGDKPLPAPDERREPQSVYMPAMLRDNVERHRRQFGRSPRTIRQHAVRWLGYVEAARILAGLGIQMELNYLSFPPYSIGFMTGSGRPLRFVDTTGEIIPCFQQSTTWTEEVLIHPEFRFSSKWTADQALAEHDRVMQQALRYYTPVTINSHPVSFATYSEPLITGAWNAASDAGIPIVSADKWLDWTAARDAVRIQPEIDGCTVHTPHALDLLTVLLPDSIRSAAGSGRLTKQRLWGRCYGALTLSNLSAGEKRRVAYELAR